MAETENRTQTTNTRRTGEMRLAPGDRHTARTQSTRIQTARTQTTRTQSARTQAENRQTPRTQSIRQQSQNPQAMRQQTTRPARKAAPKTQAQKERRFSGETDESFSGAARISQPPKKNGQAGSSGPSKPADTRDYYGEAMAKRERITILTILSFLFDTLVNLAIVAILVSGFTYAFRFGYHVFMDIPKNAADKTEVTIVIKQDTSAREVVDDVYALGVIEDKYVFLVKTYLEGYYKHMMPGSYKVSASMTNSEILMRITGQEQSD